MGKGRKAWILSLMAGVMMDEKPQGNFNDAPLAKGNKNNPLKECDICGNPHQKHSKFCSDKCTLVHIKNKRKSR
jgi:hypothetical protein